MPRKEFYTTAEVAQACNVSRATISRAIQDGLLKTATTPGGHFRIQRRDLEEFFRKNNYQLSLLGSETARVLIVEDNPAELRFFQRALESEARLDILGIGSGYEAGYLTKSFKPDLILLDIYLEDVDGRKVVKIIREDPELKRTKILAISAVKNPKDVLSIKSCGVDEFISKPISAADLKAKVKAWLKLG